jgi:broad specificity phosphatase PhoE
MPRLLLVRHGITEFNSSRRLCGYSDIELSTEGREQIKRLSRRLENERIDAAYSSDLKRASGSAKLLSRGRELEITACPELREINHGMCEGLTFDELSSRYPDIVEMYFNSSMELKFPGGEGLEAFAARVGKFLDRMDKHSPSDTVLVVSHSGPLRILTCSVLGLDPSHWWQISIDNASLSMMETAQQGMVISLLNDTSHLRVDG